MAVRIDKWLWAVRVYKTRADATDACKNNRVLIGGAAVKPSRDVKIGEEISVKKMPVVYTYKVLQEIANRQPAKNVPLYAEDLTPQEETDKLRVASGTIFIRRDRGTGRPTKKERRDIESLTGALHHSEDE